MLFCKNHAENEAGTLVPDLFLFFKKTFKNFIWGKSKGSAALLHYILIAVNLAYNKNKMYKTLDYWSRDMFNLNFLKKGLEIVSSPYFVYDFLGKRFSCYSIKWPNFIFWLPLLLEILGHMFIAVAFSQVVMSQIVKLTLSF